MSNLSVPTAATAMPKLSEDAGVGLVMVRLWAAVVEVEVGATKVYFDMAGATGVQTTNAQLATATKRRV